VTRASDTHNPFAEFGISERQGWREARAIQSPTIHIPLKSFCSQIFF
jgi:hypothetical protein